MNINSNLKGSAMLGKTHSIKGHMQSKASAVMKGQKASKENLDKNRGSDKGGSNAPKKKNG